MKRFTELYLALDGTNSTREKKELLRNYLSCSEPADAAWVIALLTGNRPRGMGASKLLRTLCLEVTKHPEWLFEECRTAIGDLSETIALLLPPPDSATDETLSAVMQGRVLPLIGASPEQRRRLILEAWSVLEPDERLVYHKLVRGGFRIGVQKRTVLRALSEAGDIDFDLLAHRMTGRFEPTARAYRRLLAPEQPGEHHERPYPFFLAHTLDQEVESLGPPADWLIEEKWDGIRAQLIVRPGERWLWSRGEEPIGHLFPELMSGLDLPEHTVLDGELLLWNEHGPRSFFDLQTRLNRTHAPEAQLKLFGSDQVRFIAYDLLEDRGEDLRALPLEDRRHRLEERITGSACEAITLSRPWTIEHWEQAVDLRDQARTRGTEGLMLKPLGSAYGTGRTRTDGGWLKWKIDPFTADAVLIGAQPGSGRRANLYTDYTFAIWNREQDPPRLVSFAKAYSGLDQTEIESLDRWIRKNTLDRNGPYRVVEPEQVFELAFEGIQRSTRHQSGIAVRFPRIARWRKDKPAVEADDVESLQALMPGEACR